MASMVASRPGRGLLVWCLAAFPLIGAVLPYVVRVCVYARVGSAIGERPGADPLMIYNAAPFVVVTLLSLGQLSSGVGRWISSVAMILIGAAYIVWLLLDAPSSWILMLPAISMVTVALTAWHGDAAPRGDHRERNRGARAERSGERDPVAHCLPEVTRILHMAHRLHLQHHQRVVRRGAARIPRRCDRVCPGRGRIATSAGCRST